MEALDRGVLPRHIPWTVRRICAGLVDAMSEIIQLFKGHQRRFYGECQRCQRTDYLPWATEHGVRYCGHCHERDALEYAAIFAKAREDR